MNDPLELAKRITNKATALDYAIQRKLACMFGERYGWNLSSGSFTLETLARGGVSSLRGSHALPRGEFDHAYYYRKNRRAVAIAAHLYDFNEAACRQIADSEGLTFDLITDFPSWWYPGWTKLVLWRASVGPAGR